MNEDGRKWKQLQVLLPVYELRACVRQTFTNSMLKIAGVNKVQAMWQSHLAEFSD